MKKKIIRACTVAQSIGFVTGMLPDLMKKYEVVIVSSPGPEMDEVKERYGVKTIAVPMERHISLKHDLVSLWRMIQVFRKEKPDMVHSMTPKAGLLCMMAGWLTRVPVRVHTFTGLVFPTSTGLKRRILMLTDSITCWCATHVIPEGEGVKADLRNHGITHKPLKVLGYGNVMGVDMERFSRRENQLSVISYQLSDEDTDGLRNENGNGTQISQIPQINNDNENENLKTQNLKNTELITDNTELITENFVFLFVGRIVRDKGINELMAAFKRLNEKYPETELVLVGAYEESLDPVSEETLAIIKENPAVHHVGVKRGDDLVAEYAAADCFVFPSYREGFPNTVLEAGAMGLPSIVTDINGSREIIVEKFRVESGECRDSSEVESFKSSDIKHQTSDIRLHRNGIIVPPRDEEALYAAMERMVTDKEMRESMAAKARPLIAERFEQGFVRRCLYEFYEGILP
jgi:glycosyltransferase involved in cell wall biosynthesis